MQEIHYWPIRLNERPRLMLCGQAVHGRSRRSVIEKYLLPTLWSIHVYNYHAQLLVNGEKLVVQPGCVSVVPPNSQLEYHYHGLSPHFFAHFSLPETGDASAQIPVLQDLGTDFSSYQSEVEQMGTRFLTAPLRAEVKLWDLLWQLAERTPQSQRATLYHPALEQALQLIEQRIEQNLVVADLARAVGISHNHLTRLFQANLGLSVVATIRQRRARRARHLLQHSTLAIKVIASQVGVPDLRQFNQLMRRETGLSPRALRKASLVR